MHFFLSDIMDTLAGSLLTGSYHSMFELLPTACKELHAELLTELSSFVFCSLILLLDLLHTSPHNSAFSHCSQDIPHYRSFHRHFFFLPQLPSFGSCTLLCYDVDHYHTFHKLLPTVPTLRYITLFTTLCYSL